MAAADNLVFARGDMRQCHRVEISQDGECEPDPESFFLNMALVDGFDVTTDPARTQVLIDDALEPECGEKCV